MPVEIQLLPSFKLGMKENAQLHLPSIQIVPNKSNIPHISRITCIVRGTPYQLAAKIQSSYRQFNSVTPKQISNICQLGQDICQLDTPLMTIVDCTLKVIVEYFDSDVAGNPNLSISNHVCAECDLWFIPNLEKSSSSSTKNYPAMNTSQFDHYLNNLSQQLSEKLNEKQRKRFPGWLALDFGTSNSTVTLFDPIEVPIAEVLPREQELRLRERMAEWLNSPSDLALSDVSGGEWEKFLADISRNLEIESDQLSEIFETDNKELFLEAIRQIELCLGTSDRFRRAVSKKLYAIYHEVFRVPTLESQNLIPVVLDIDRRSTEIPSEMEVSQLIPLKLRMGRDARDNRKKAIAQGTTASIKDIISRFHHSPKRYFGQDRFFPITLEEDEENIQVNRLIQAAWAQLIELTEDYRQRARRRFSEGDFLTAVVTYPTVAPPVVRKEIKQLVQELGIDDVQTAYDEAVSVAIFFLWREFGGNLNIGIESFKTRCRQNGNKWSQNVL
ncbi:MAG: molecular chaperone, partial [Aphanizomenon sp.]